MLFFFFYCSFRPQTIIQNNRYPTFNYWRKLFNRPFVRTLSILLLSWLFLFIPLSINFLLSKIGDSFHNCVSRFNDEGGGVRRSDRHRVGGNCSKTRSNFRTRRLMEIGWYATRTGSQDERFKVDGKNEFNGSSGLTRFQASGVPARFVRPFNLASRKYQPGREDRGTGGWAGPREIMFACPFWPVFETRLPACLLGRAHGSSSFRRYASIRYLSPSIFVVRPLETRILIPSSETSMRGT